MKKIVFFLLLLNVSLWAGNNWLVNFDDAQQEALKTDKKIMLYFSGSDWCRPCILLKKKVFETEQFENFARENLILVMLDFPAHEQNKLSEAQIEHNEKIAEIYNPAGNFPFIVIVSQSGVKMSEIIGYNNDSAIEYIKKLKEGLKKG